MVEIADCLAGIDILAAWQSNYYIVRMAIVEVEVFCWDSSIGWIVPSGR